MSENETSRAEGKVTDLMEALSVSLERAKADRRAPAPRADEGAERSKPHLLHGVFDSDGLTRFRLECPYEVKGVLPAGRRCWSLDDDGEIDSLQCFAKGWVDECGAELISFEITDPSFPIEVDVELHGLLQTPNLTLHVRSASSGDGGAPTDPYDTLHMLDVFLALGGTDEEFAEWIDGRAFADAWPQLVAAVAGRIDSLRADSNPPAGVLLKIAERRAAPSPVPEEGPLTRANLVKLVKLAGRLPSRYVAMSSDLGDMDRWAVADLLGQTLDPLDDLNNAPTDHEWIAWHAANPRPGATPEQGEGPAK